MLDATADGSSDADLEQHLRWQGFSPIAPNVYAKPNVDVDAARNLFARLDVRPAPMVATATFDEISPVATTDTFRAESGLARAERAYGEFVDTYGWTLALEPGELPPRASFLLRTMVVHDLRRSRLADPELPAELLPAGGSAPRP